MLNHHLHDNGYFVELEEYEDLYGTSQIEWFEEFRDAYPSWLRDLMNSDKVSKQAILEYVYYRKGEFDL